METKQIVKSTQPFVDAQEMRKNHPETFERATEEELKELKVGNFAKVCTGAERFWVQVTSIEGDKIQGTVDNELVCTDEHGLKYEDLIEFEFKNIYDITE